MSDARDDLDPLDEETEYRPKPDRISSGRRAAVSRFTPGTLLGDRYRIVAIVGSGGMGEVYRADDLKLGQQVALKFLPQEFGSDPSRIERLYAEVRIGRQVSHPNVCRLYDIGEWEGHHFLAMEYVDGEDLSSLLRRIGKLPHDKALELARDICTGLAAAHGLGIVHRDLKPANIMIDGRGTARITDFGLAAVAEEIAGRAEVVGTPLYMAPEQLTGENVTPKTDLYALGLILFEMFTGRRLFESAASDLNARRSITRSHSLSSHTRDIDPAVQRVILRCLEEQPEARPASIHSVIAALPGGDPLQAAVDAGETPSPQMVAAAGETGELAPRVAWTLLAATIVGLVIAALLHGRAILFRRVPLPKEPAVLIERAKSIIQRAGYPVPPADTAVYFDADADFFEYARKKAGARDPLAAIARTRPGIFTFGYRQSPRSLIAANREGRVVFGDPPRTVPGMADVFLDTHGRLLGFAVVPEPLGTPTSREPDWRMFFEEAGGDLDNVRPVQPLWTPPFGAHRQYAWTANFRGDSTPVRIEAAAHNGKPIWFEIVGPWRKPQSAAAPTRTGVRRILESIGFLIADLAPFLGAIVLARWNLRRGRGDRRGATRLAVFVFGCALLGRTIRLDHVSVAGSEWDLLMRAVALSLFDAAMMWLLYVAVEPYVRRRWPHLLIGWSRLFAGRWRDPMIGRDVLIGATAGLTLASLRMFSVQLPAVFGGTALEPINRWVSPLISVRHFLYLFLDTIRVTIQLSLFLCILLVLMLFLTRRRALAVAVVWCLAVLLINDFGDGMAWRIGVGVIMATVAIGVLVRFGVLAFFVGAFIDAWVVSAPLTLDVDAWYFGRSVAALLAVVAIAAYGFYTSLGQKPLFAMAELEDA